MDNKDISNAFSELSTPLIADACLRLKLPLRIAPPNIRSIISVLDIPWWECRNLGRKYKLTRR